MVVSPPEGVAVQPAAPQKNPEKRAARVAPAVAIPVAMPVAARAPVARPVEAPRAAPASRRKFVIGGSAGAVLLVIVAVVLSLPERSPDRKNGGRPPPPPPPPPPVAVRREISVSPTGDFRTIAEALADTKKHVSKSRRAVQTIKVAGGRSYSERIVLDETFPRGVQLVVEGDQPAILSPPGSEPIITVSPKSESVENFRLEGFLLDAAGKEVAVRLSEWVPGAKLRRLQITGFSKVGILIDGVQTFGDERDIVLIDQVTFRGAAPDAVGVEFRRRTEDPRYVRMQKCRFLGPLAAGVLVDSNVIGLEVAESIFSQTATGVTFSGENRMWRDVVLAFNTFHVNDKALVFTHMPSPESADLGFYNNLFFGSKTADAVIEKNLNIAAFLQLYRTTPGGSSYNWTTRPRPDKPRPEENLYLFETTGGRFDADSISFASTDPSSPEFLAPASTSPQRNVGSMLTDKRYNRQTQIGAPTLP
jgi:hypothetical protein